MSPDGRVGGPGGSVVGVTGGVVVAPGVGVVATVVAVGLVVVGAGAVVDGGRVAGAPDGGPAAAATRSPPTDRVASTITTEATATSTTPTTIGTSTGRVRPAGADAGSTVRNQPRSSAQTANGGTTTRALRTATEMLTVTIAPKSRSRGRDEKISTAKPPTVVNAEAMKARPVRCDARALTSFGAKPSRRPSM